LSICESTDIYGWVPDESDKAAAEALDGLFSESTSRGLIAAYDDRANGSE
jgi:hypothetical protein